MILMHDWLTGFRGGERVLEVFADLFPAAPLYTLVYEKGSTSSSIENRKIKASFLNGIPGIGKSYRKFLPLFPMAIDMMKVTEASDRVLSSSHCVIKGLKKPEGSVHVSYIHSPMRYMYDQYDSYFGADAPALQRWGARACRGYLTRWDRESNANVDLMVANSSFVRERIRKFYGRDAMVVHPFVDLKDFAAVQTAPPSRADHFIMVTAFAPNKRVDLAIDTFNELKLPLTIIGSGQQEQMLRARAGSTITFKGNLSRAEVVHELATARALIFPGVEDFGIVPLEAMAAGTPVIAFRAGGVLETLTEEDTVFFDEPTASSLKAAVQEMVTRPRKPRIERLAQFSKERFAREMKQVIEDADRLSKEIR